jgi:glutamate N-acetyltransferase / amino-acid N-acetyltransferase
VSLIEFHKTPVLPRGFRCASRNCGLKPDAKDIALFVSEVDASAAAVFTRNHFPGAPIVLGRDTIRGGVLRGIFVNTKVSNVATGLRGIENAMRMAAAAAKELDVPPEHVLVSSTGVIGAQLPIEKIEKGIIGMTAELQGDPMIGAEGIMTTDSYPKAVSLSVGEATITLVAKGSGMIEPNMATMLAYIFTDAWFAPEILDRMLRSAVEVSFNMLSVDGDTSTSDTCAIMANGMAGPVSEPVFEAALLAGCVRMTEVLARDGEGANHLIRATVRGAKSLHDARAVAKSLINSPLIKTMVHGADPNVGRLLMAVGKSFESSVRPASTDAWINGHLVVRHGERIDFDDATVRGSLKEEIVEIVVDLGLGEGTATAYGCDFTHGYIDENAAYLSS